MTSEELVAPTEVLPPVGSNPSLAPRQLQAAIAEAGGASRKQVAEIAGVTESAIKQWRQKPEYIGEVERLKAAYGTALQEPVQRLHKALIEGATDAVHKLKEALRAEDPKGNPMWGIRLDAARLLMQNGVELTKEQQSAISSAGKAAPGGVVQLQVNVGRD